VPFRRVADVLHVSEQTIARRYQRLRNHGVVRVVGLVDIGRSAQTDWQLRLRARSDHVVPLATALAARDDVSWVSLGSGGTEVLASLSSPSAADRDDLLLRRLPGSTRVLDMAALAMLHRFAGPEGHDFRLPSKLVGPAEAADLLVPRAWLAADAPALRPDDGPLIAALADDGRASVAQLARASGFSEARTGQRLRLLIASGRVYIDVDIAQEAFGYRSSAHLFLTVEPRHLDTAGTTLAVHPSVAFAAATTGSTNLYVVAVMTDPALLYRFVNEELGGLDGVRQVEIIPILRWIKQAGTLVEGQRLRALARR
jgi:DNA-binding Lrp family transcriptional regulator